MCSAIRLRRGPTLVTYSAAISACKKGRMPQQALNLLQEMQLRSLLPDVIEIASRDRRTNFALSLIDCWHSS